MLDGPASLELIYPSIEFSEIDLPELKKWEVGKDYTLKMKVTQKEIREGRSGELYGRFEIKELGVADNPHKKKYA
jgi:hypothetical protein